jgi:hypothetical protein
MFRKLLSLPSDGNEQQLTPHTAPTSSTQARWAQQPVPKLYRVINRGAMHMLIYRDVFAKPFLPWTVHPIASLYTDYSLIHKEPFLYVFLF